MAPYPFLTLLDAGLRGTAVAWLALLAYALHRDRPRLNAARVGVALALGLCVQLVGSAPTFEAQVAPLWQAPAVGIAVGNAVLFWVFVCALFDDEFALRPQHVACWATAAALGSVNCMVGAHADSPLGAAAVVAQRGVPALFALLAAQAAASHWRDDLIEARRRLRAFILVAGIGYSLAQLGARLGSPHGRLTGTLATLDVAALLAIAGVLAARLLRLAPTDLFPAAPVAARRDVPAGLSLPTAAKDAAGPVVPSAADDALAAALRALMTEQRAYREDHLTVAALARRLGVPEYRLRRLINQRLGQRNFNAYVNSFRLEDARSALADPARKDVAVLTVALDAGFQSIGPFNRAFKAATGRTPTEYRREQLAET
jgi:AraC-like DNA-binding protein